MGLYAAAGFALAGFALVGGAATLWSRGTMRALPAYDADAATDPVALARVVVGCLASFGVLTFAFAVLEAAGEATETVVAAYGVAVLVVGLGAAGVTRRYE